jgi:hypothetical protein
VCVSRSVWRTSSERRGRVVSCPASYPGGPRFKSRVGNRVSWGCSCFPNSLKENAGIIPKVGHDRLLLNPFHFFIYLTPFHSLLYNLLKKAPLHKIQINKLEKNSYQSLWNVCSLYNDPFPVTHCTSSDERAISEWLIGKDSEGSGCGLILMYYPIIRLEDWVTPRKASIRIAGLWAAIWTRDLPYVKQEC